MKKTLFAFCLAVCGMIMPVSGQPLNESKLQFNSSVKYVDAGGEFFYYSSNKAAIDMCNQYLPLILKTIWEKESYAAVANDALDSSLKLLNLGAFKAQAASSVEVAPGIFVAKAFSLTDMNAKSILIDPAAKNQPLNYLALPADTRVALKAQVNFAHIWNMLYDEVKNHPNPEIKKLTADLDMIKQQYGVDAAAIACSIVGDLEILITGTTKENAAIKVVIPDKDGAVAALLQKFLPMTKENKAVIPVKEIGMNFTIIYGKGKITVVSDEKLLAAPVKTLASSPNFQKFAKYLPVSGNGYMIVDIPQELIDYLYKELDINEAPVSFKTLLDKIVKPIAIAAVFRVEKDGYYAVSASNFSLPQTVTMFQGLPVMLPILALADSMDRNDKASALKCVNNLKQFSLACLMYAQDNKDTLPPELDALIEKKYLDEEICEDIIFLACGKNISKIQNPATFPIAICDRFSHDKNTVCVAFADGHVEAVEVPEEADDKGVIAILHKKYNFPAEYMDQILKLLAEEDEGEE